MKKRLLSFSLVMLLCALLCPLSQASGALSYALPALGVSVFVPPDCVVLTADSAENDPGFAALQLTKQSLLALFSESGRAFYAYQKQSNCEIWIARLSSADTCDDNLRTDAEVLGSEQDLAQLRARLSAQGITYQKSELFSKNNQTKFSLLWMTSAGNGVVKSTVQCKTVYAGNTFVIDVISPDKQCHRRAGSACALCRGASPLPG